MNKYIYIGKFAASVGLKGELILKHILGKKTIFKLNDVLFIDAEKDIYLPYFVEDSISKSNTDTVVKIEGINSKEQASKFIHKKIWLTTDDFEKRVSKTAPVNLTGFLVVNDNEELGRVEAVIEQPQQVLLQINMQQKEVLIPLHEETLKKIDRKKKQVHVILPEGLLEIYLNASPGNI